MTETPIVRTGKILSAEKLREFREFIGDSTLTPADIVSVDLSAGIVYARDGRSLKCARTDQDSLIRVLGDLIYSGSSSFSYTFPEDAAQT